MTAWLETFRRVATKARDAYPDPEGRWMSPIRIMHQEALSLAASLQRQGRPVPARLAATDRIAIRRWWIDKGLPPKELWQVLCWLAEEDCIDLLEQEHTRRQAARAQVPRGRLLTREEVERTADMRLSWAASRLGVSRRALGAARKRWLTEGKE